MPKAAYKKEEETNLTGKTSLLTSSAGGASSARLFPPFSALSNLLHLRRSFSLRAQTYRSFVRCVLVSIDRQKYLRVRKFSYLEGERAIGRREREREKRSTVILMCVCALLRVLSVRALGFLHTTTNKGLSRIRIGVSGPSCLSGFLALGGGGGRSACFEGLSRGEFGIDHFASVSFRYVRVINFRSIPSTSASSIIVVLPS